MSPESNHLLIYLIVLLNALSQIMLIWRLKSLGTSRFAYMGLAAALPLVLSAMVRTLVALGVINGRVADQSHLEHLLTQIMSILLIAGPWLTTAAAVMSSRGRKGRTLAIAQN
jgi:hypothetical protein